MKNFSLTVCLLILSGLVLTGCNSGEEPDNAAKTEGRGISVEEPWARPAGTGRTSAAYFLISNSGGQPDTLSHVSSDVAQLTEIHESFQQEEGMMGMRKVNGLAVPAGSTVRFEPGGLHVMFMQLTHGLVEGDEFDLTLHFKDQGDVVIPVPVRSAAEPTRQ
ncbi:MAG: copper chaperone PCu(A)C [Balneolaceae bacterium]